jgi:hypothetical protein
MSEEAEVPHDPPTEIIQAIGFDVSSSCLQNSGSICPMRRTSRISFALLASVLFGTPVSALRSSPVRCGRCVRSNKKFTLPTASIAAAAQMRRSPRASVDGLRAHGVNARVYRRAHAPVAWKEVHVAGSLRA